MKIDIPRDHPRHDSLLMRERVVEGYENAVVAAAGLVAHGRGEAFDYLLGERTPPFAQTAIDAAACAFILAEHPVISVNGNVAALCPHELVELSRATAAPLEVNLFYRTREREEAVARALREAGAETVLGVGDHADSRIPELGSERRRVDSHGIAVADLVFVPLEDGDRTEALVKMGKRVVTVDLNPLSRTAKRASISIVDNVIRVMPSLIDAVRETREQSPAKLQARLSAFDNGKNLAQALRFLAARLQTLAETKIE